MTKIKITAANPEDQHIADQLAACHNSIPEKKRKIAKLAYKEISAAIEKWEKYSAQELRCHCMVMHNPKSTSEKMKMKHCETCGTKANFNEGYDAFYCPECNIWLEVSCGDSRCPFCPERPERPLGKFKKLLNKLFRPNEKAKRT